jgi:hypothetical protein
MDIFEKLQNLDKRVFYLLMALAIAIPTISPIGLPIDVTKPVQDTYNFVSNLPDGSKVVIGFDYEPGDEIDLNPIAQAIFHQLASKGIKVVALASFPAGPTFAEDAWLFWMNTGTSTARITLTWGTMQVASLRWPLSPITHWQFSQKTGVETT